MLSQGRQFQVNKLVLPPKIPGFPCIFGGNPIFRRSGRVVELNKNNFIKIECNNWYVREDNLIQVCTQAGGKVILNKTFSDVWTNIEYETSVEDLWNRVKNNTSWDQFEEIIKQLELNNLIKVVDEDSEFNEIFN